ncbi:mevalonate kinase [Candidatus Binatia bacterium]|nr:mevalonate kinase [Candidatus Binatia bacterium]
MTGLRPVARGTAPGKVILLGEHAVVYGRPALATAIDRHVSIALDKGTGQARLGLITALGPGEGSTEIQPAVVPPSTPAPALSGVELPPIDDPRLAEALARAAGLFAVAHDSFAATISADLPLGVGLGSSAALSVALIRALAEWVEEPLPLPEVCARAFELEKIFHGFPSGIDNTVATYGGAVVFQHGVPVRPLRTPAAVPLVIALGTLPRETRRTVTMLRERRAAEPARHERIFDAIADLVCTAEAALQTADYPQLGALMGANHEWLVQLGVSTPELDRMVDCARRHGALGAKLTGGGGGGAVICLCPTNRETLVEAFVAAGWHAFATDLAIPQRGFHDRDRYDSHAARA